MTWATILVAAISGALGGLAYSLPRIIRDHHQQRKQEELTRQQSGIWWVLECAWCGGGFKCRPQDWDACMAQHEATCARQVPEEGAALLDHDIDQRQPPSPGGMNTQTPNTEETK